jgi:hypothetical protein
VPRTLHIEDTPLIENEADLLGQDGRHALPGELAGAKIHLEVQGGEIVGHEAERDGETIETFVLRELPNQLAGEQQIQGVRCYLCACSGDSCTCRSVPCPGGG